MTNMNRFDEAEHFYREALKIKPDHIPAHLTMGRMFNRKVYSFISFFAYWKYEIVRFPQVKRRPRHVAQSVMCLATDGYLTADQGVAIRIPARSHTFVEIEHEIISLAILLPSTESFKKGCCQLQAKVCA